MKFSLAVRHGTVENTLQYRMLDDMYSLMSSTMTATTHDAANSANRLITVMNTRLFTL